MSCSQEEKFPLYSKYVVFCHITLPCTLYREIFKCHSLTKQYLFSYYDKSGVTFQKYLVTKHLICNSCIFKANYMWVSWCTVYSSRSPELLALLALLSFTEYKIRIYYWTARFVLLRYLLPVIVNKNQCKYNFPQCVVPSITAIILKNLTWANIGQKYSLTNFSKHETSLQLWSSHWSSTGLHKLFH